MLLSPSPDAVVVGGGLVGCLTARALCADHRRVLLLEAGPDLGQGSSSAAAGLLSPQMEAAEEILVTDEPDGNRHDAMLGLCLVARGGYAAFVEEVEAESGLGVHYRVDGTLIVALDEGEARRLEHRAAAQRGRGLRADWLDVSLARSLEPALAADAIGALHLPDDHQVDNVALVAAVKVALHERTATDVRTGTPVRGLVIERGRVAAVQLGHAVVPTPVVVLAAGAWTAGIAGLPRTVPVRPVKGQMAALLPRAPIFRRVIGGRGVYCVPRDDGRVLVGATVEEAGFDLSVEPAALERLLDSARAVVPGLGKAPLLSGWAGLRPGTSDDLPILGSDPAVAGLLWATGHYRNGILLAPLTASIVAALARGEPPPVDLAPFAPDRFG